MTLQTASPPIAPSVDCHPSARTLLEAGFHVHPLCSTTVAHDHGPSDQRERCTSPGKIPHWGRWQKVATPKPAYVEGWPVTGIGVRTGDGGLIVFDVDDGAEGRAEWRAAWAEQGMESSPPTTITPREGGGEHYWFRFADGPRPNTTKTLFRHIDTRGDGGQVVCPPSPHQNGGRYEWGPGGSPNLAELPELPDFLGRLLQQDTPDDAIEPVRVNGKIREGARHTAMLKALGEWLCKQPELDRDATVTWTRKWNRANCDPPLPSAEVRTMARDIHAKEAKKRDARAAEFDHPSEPLSVEAVWARYTDLPAEELLSWTFYRDYEGATFVLETTWGGALMPMSSKVGFRNKLLHVTGGRASLRPNMGPWDEVVRALMRAATDGGLTGPRDAEEVVESYLRAWLTSLSDSATLSDRPYFERGEWRPELVEGRIEHFSLPAFHAFLYRKLNIRWDADVAALLPRAGWTYGPVEGFSGNRYHRNGNS